MAKLLNLARMTTTTTGTGTITLGSAVSGYLTFALAGVSNGDVVSYGIKDGASSEVGTGTYTSSGTTLTRSVTKSTNSDAAISLSGSAEVYITARAEDLDVHTATNKTTPVDADEVGLIDSAASYVLKHVTWANIKATIYAAWGALLNAGTPKATPVDADLMGLADSAASFATKTLSWANLKTTLSNLYAQLAASNVFTASQTISTSSLSTLLAINLAEDSATAGPTVSLYRNSASPAVSDVAGQISWSANNSSAASVVQQTQRLSLTNVTAGTEANTMEWFGRDAGSFVKMLSVGPGVMCGSPTGGMKAIGEINAKAVYDDNSILTCYVLEAENTGKIDQEVWDSRVPNIEIEDLGEDQAKKTKVIIPRTHEPAAKFSKRMDELDPDTFSAKWKKTGVLPGMPTPEEWAENPKSTGDMIQRLWEMCELQAVHISRLSEQIKALK